MDHLTQHIESLIFTAEKPIDAKEIKKTLEEVFEAKFKIDDIISSVEKLIVKYRNIDFSFEIAEIAGGYLFMTKGAFEKTVGIFLKQSAKKRLSKAALETLAIIAYKQPVTKTEMEQIRGVSCDYSVHKLLEKELISIEGRDEGPGRPILYGTSEKFMDYFGLKSLKELPALKDFKTPDNQIGEQAPIEEEQ